MRRFLIMAGLWVATIASGRAAETVAQAWIPFESLTETNRVLVRGVTDHYTLRREYAKRQRPGRLAQLNFLLENMEACSILAMKLGDAKFRAVQDKQGRTTADNREGSSGFMLVALTEPTNHVFFVQGRHKGAFEVHGRAVAVVRATQVETNTVELAGIVFVRVDNGLMATLAQLFIVFVQSAVDKNFEHVMKHPLRVCKVALETPDKVRAAAAAMPAKDQEIVAPFLRLLEAAPASGP